MEYSIHIPVYTPTAAIFDHNRVSSCGIGLWCKKELTLQGPWIDEVNRAGDTGAHAQLTHVPQALSETWWETHDIVLATKHNTKSKQLTTKRIQQLLDSYSSKLC